MKVQTNAVNLLERTSAYLRAGLLTKAPAWYNVVASVPPSKSFAREPKITNPSNNKNIASLSEYSETVGIKNGTYKTRQSGSDRKVSFNKLYKAPKLNYAEDKLRELFYQQHPWELSRPKVLIENTGEESYDWSTIQQLGKPLDGESVVQRTLYLLKEKKQPTLLDAYDQARFEFYRVRVQQEIHEQVAQEEAEMFGSVFGSSSIEYGLEKEQKVIETWKKKAIQQTELMAARSSGPSAAWENAAEANEESVEQDVEELQL